MAAVSVHGLIEGVRRILRFSRLSPYGHHVIYRKKYYRDDFRHGNVDSVENQFGAYLVKSTVSRDLQREGDESKQAF